ncbi:MAG: FecR family protein [Spirochaetes bacterium]|nr:FecR family protein [Spirochaetota bacterium]
MRKLQKIMMMVSLFCIMQLVIAGHIFAHSGQHTGVIRDLSGTVELRHAGAENFVPATAGARVPANTVISTGFRSSALVEIGGAVITVRPLTQMTLAELSTAAGTETINVSLQTGRVRVDVTPPAGTRTSMEVRGPNVTASVRGTGFDFNARALTVDHGSVAYRGNRGGTVMVGAGAASIISDTGRAVDPVEVSIAALTPPAPAGSDSGSSAFTTTAPGDSAPRFSVGVTWN